VAGAGGEVAALRLATWLEERGRIEDAVGGVRRPSGRARSSIASSGPAVPGPQQAGPKGTTAASGVAVGFYRPHLAGLAPSSLADLLIEAGRPGEVGTVSPGRGPPA
jgi:hypothetical protein